MQLLESGGDQTHQIVPGLVRFLAEARVTTLLLFAHPGFEPTLAVLRYLNESLPDIRITLLTHVTLTTSQRASLPVESVITFDKRAVNHPLDLLRMGWNVLRSVRSAHFDVSLMWCRGFEVSQHRLLFELFAVFSRACKAFFWDDQSGSFQRISRSTTLVFRLPWTFIKLLILTLLILLVWMIVKLVLLGRSLLSVRPRRLLSTKKNVTVGFLRTDIELAIMPMTVGGSVSHVKGMIQGFLATGCRCVGYASGPLAGIDPLQVRTRVIHPWLSSDVPLELIEIMANFPFILKGVFDMRREGIDFIYQRYSMNNFSGLVLSRILGIPMVLEANNSEVVMRTKFSRLAFPFLARTLERLILLSADLVVTVSECNRQTFLSLGVPADRIHVLPNAVDPDKFSPLRGDGGLRKSLGLEGKLAIGFVGLFYPWHGVTHLAKAFVQVAGRIPEAHLVLVGDGDDRPNVEAILADAGIEDRVTLIGMIPHEQVPLYLNAMDIVVSPHAPWNEFFGSPIKLFEYMSAARAIVASDIGQIGQIIRDGHNGLLFTAGDDGALSKAIIRLCHDERLRKKLGQAARKDVLSHHTWLQTARQVLTLIGIPRSDHTVESA